MKYKDVIASISKLVLFIVFGLGLLYLFTLKPKIPVTGKSAIAKAALYPSAVEPKASEVLESAVPPLAAFSAGKSKMVPILMYHHIGIFSSQQRLADSVGSDLTVSPSDFEAEVKFLHDSGYSSISLQQLYNSLINGASLPAKPIILTFDDGYQDTFINGIPILQKYGYTGTFAIATALLGRPSYAEWSDVLAADKAGMEIVSHTENHLDLTSTQYSAADLQREIFGAKTELEKTLDHPVNFFVYPYGRYNQHIEDLVQQAGYQMAFTTAFGLYQNPETLLAEPRVRVHGIETMDKFKFSLGLGSRTAASPINP